MKPENLIKGNEYLYTAGDECVKVKFLHETVNGYLFTDGNTESELTGLTIENYIEKITIKQD